MESILGLCRASLGWKASDPNEAFFNWKHVDNAFGESPSWVATTGDGDIVGLRVFMRWEFCGPGGRTYRAVRAVDTATHPDFQGRGIFTKLTLAGVEELTADGVDFVFNTPNDKSMPGYLKMGWQVVGRIPVSVRVRSPMSAARLRGAKAAAGKWSSGTSAGIDARTVLADKNALERLLSSVPEPQAIHTPRSANYYQWRYDFAPLGYRALPLGDIVEDGFIVFRVRTRGTATELTVCDVVAPRRASVGTAVGHLLRSAKADYAISTSNKALEAGPSKGFVPVRRLGPIMTWREVTRSGIPQMKDLGLTMGDVELF